MKKSRSDSKWFSLSKAKISQLQSWLFDDHLSYDDALARAKSELGFTGSKSSLQRFYRRTALDRSLTELLDANNEAAEINSSPASQTAFLHSSMKLLSQALFQQVQTQTITDLPALAKILLLSQLNQIKNEDNQIKRQNQLLREKRLHFEKERWQFDTIEEALKRLPQLQELQQQRQQQNDPWAENKHLNDIMRQIFGKEAFGFRPENEEEERQMKEAEAREEAQRQRREEELLAAECEAAERRQAELPQATPNPENQPAEGTQQTSQPNNPPEPPKVVWQDTEETNRYPFNDRATVARWKDLFEKSRKFA